MDFAGSEIRDRAEPSKPPHGESTEKPGPEAGRWHDKILPDPEWMRWRAPGPNRAATVRERSTIDDVRERSGSFSHPSSWNPSRQGPSRRFGQHLIPVKISVSRLPEPHLANPFDDAANFVHNEPSRKIQSRIALPLREPMTK